MPVRSEDRIKEKIISRSLLKNSGIKVGRERDKYVFIVPAEKADEIKKQYGFSFDMLKVGGDISLSELAVHVDEQASVEANISLVCEICRYKLENERNSFEQWFEALYYKCRRHMMESEKTPTEAFVRGYMQNKYKAEISERKNKIADLEFQYRLLVAFRSAIEKKGELLPTLRNIVQGKSEGVGSIDVKVEQPVRLRLKM